MCILQKMDKSLVVCFSTHCVYILERALSRL